MKKWYEELFENYATKYDNENFVQGTIGELIFLKKKSDIIRRYESWILDAVPEGIQLN